MPSGNSFRVVKESDHNLLLDRVSWVYSSSANLSGEGYDEDYAKENAEVIVSTPHQQSGEASTIYKLSQTNIRSIRS